MTDPVHHHHEGPIDDSVELDVTVAERRAGRILVTNDDGIESPGLRLLALALAERYDDVLVAAPATDLSGTGTGIGRYDPDFGVGLHRDDIEGVEAYALDGPPGLAVMAASMGAFGPAPQLVISGVNAGMNTGHSVLHSGTVGGALTASTFGCCGMAVSLQVEHVERRWWDTAVAVAVSAAGWMLEQQPPTVLNVNVPGRPLDQVRGVCWAHLDRFGYFHLASADLEGKALTLDVADRGSGEDPDCDTSLCMAGYVTLTALTTVEPAPRPPADADAIVRLPA